MTTYRINRYPGTVVTLDHGPVPAVPTDIDLTVEEYAEWAAIEAAYLRATALLTLYCGARLFARGWASEPLAHALGETFTRDGDARRLLDAGWWRATNAAGDERWFGPFVGRTAHTRTEALGKIDA